MGRLLHEPASTRARPGTNMHHTANPPFGVEQPWPERAAPVLAAAALALVVVAPRSNVLALALLIGAAGLSTASMPRWPAISRLSMVGLSALAFGAWALIATTWAVQRGEAVSKALTLLAIVVAVQAGVNLAQTSDPVRLRAMSRSAVVVALAGALFLFVEVLFGQPIHRLVFRLAPFLQPDPKHMLLAGDGSVLGMKPYVLNRHLGAFALTLLPVLLMATLRFSGGARWVIVMALVALSGMAAVKSEHETTALALGAALIAFAGMSFAPRLMRGMIVAAWVTATLLVVPIAGLVYSAGLHTAAWIPQTGRNRIILWSVTAREIAKTPIRGIGPASTRELDEKAGPSAPRPEDHSYALRTGRHAHNVYMQTWYELGGIGAVLLLVLGLAGLRTLSRLPVHAEPYAMASFVAAAVIGAFSWGMWQAWFTAAFGIWIVLLAFATSGMAKR